MKQDAQVLRPKAGARALCAATYITGVVLLTMHLRFGIPDHHPVWLVPAFAIFGLFFLADLFITRIVLPRESIQLISNWSLMPLV